MLHWDMSRHSTSERANLHGCFIPFLTRVNLATIHGPKKFIRILLEWALRITGRGCRLIANVEFYMYRPGRQHMIFMEPVVKGLTYLPTVCSPLMQRPASAFGTFNLCTMTF